MAGITRLSAPKTARLSTVQTTPMTAEGRFSGLRHCSRNSTTKSAVRAKSIPVVSKGIRSPTAAPRRDAASQYP